MKKLVWIAMFLLAGCATPGVTPPIVTVDTPTANTVYPRPDPISSLPVKWKIFAKVNEAEAAKILAAQALVCTSPQGYEALSKNMADVLRYLQQVDALLTKYEDERRANQK